MKNLSFFKICALSILLLIILSTMTGIYLLTSISHEKGSRIAVTSTQTMMFRSERTIAAAAAAIARTLKEVLQDDDVPSSNNDKCSNQSSNWKAFLPKGAQLPIHLLTINMLMSNSSPIVWPVFVINTKGRLGNCLNSYATALALQEEFLGRATVAIGADVYANIAKVMDYRSLSCWVVDHDVMPCTRVLGMRETIAIKHQDDYTRHLRPTIKSEIQKYSRSAIKKIFKFPGYHNQLSLFAGSQQRIHRDFRLRPELVNKARSFLQATTKKRGTKTTYIGFHIRRTDYEQRMNKTEQIPLPGIPYYQSAMAYYRRRFRNPVFVVCSDDITYARFALRNSSAVVYSDLSSAAEDMALLASCNHSVMTVGSFGFWSSWLTSGHVVYTLYTTYNRAPFLHPVRMGPKGYNNFRGILVDGSIVEIHKKIL